MACDESLIYSPIVICKQILDVQAYGTSCLFSLSALQFEAQMGISIGWKQEPWRGGSLLFWDTVQTHYGTIKASLVGKKQRKYVQSVSLMFGMLFINSRGHEEAMKSRQLKLKLPLLWTTALDHCSGSLLWITALGWNWAHGLFSFTVSPLLLDAQRCAAHCGELITVCAPALVLHTYLLLGGMKRGLNFGSNLAWPLTTRNVGKYISIRAPTL